MKKEIQKIKYKIECCECCKEIKSNLMYQLDEMNYCCSEDCLEKLVD